MCIKHELLDYFKTTSTKLEKQPTKNKATKNLQTLLNELGFADELQFDKYGADGGYGNLTQQAVASFLAKNKLNGDGSFIYKSTAELMLKRHDTLDELQVLALDLDANKVENIYCYKSKQKVKIQALQTLLNELGYGKTLQWNRYKNDGDYGDLTTKAVVQFAKDNKIDGDGKKLTKELAQLIVEKLASYYGKHWKRHSLTEIVSDNSNPLVDFTDSNFVGKRVVTDKDFAAALKRINKYAKDSKILIHVTSSYRIDANVSGAIVTPSKMSNHMVGHAIDMNVRYGDDYKKWCNSAALSKPTLPEPVAKFIGLIRADGELRWGGDFRKKDSVHIDDYYNKNADNWKKKFEQIKRL
jgi:peptidoglycan hydrolase-like protein with peptidoglycan-binding domain